MFVLLLCSVLTSSDVDHHCREKFGHPGDLGVTSKAEQYFSSKTSYVEASATIGELGTEVPNGNPDTKTYHWQNGKLEMQFRSDRLARYRLDGKWTSYFVPSEFVIPHADARARQNGSDDRKHPANDAGRKKEFEDFQRTVIEIIQVGNQATESTQERTDLKALRYHVTKLSEAIAASDWEAAEGIRDGMQFSLQRSHAVAIDTERRLTVRKRAEEERRHREEMRQRERQHREQLRQQEAILNELRIRRGY